MRLLFDIILILTGIFHLIWSIFIWMGKITYNRGLGDYIVFFWEFALLVGTGIFASIYFTRKKEESHEDPSKFGFGIFLMLIFVLAMYGTATFR